MNKNTTKQSASLFENDECYSQRWQIFQQSKLGQLYQAIPFIELSRLLPEKQSNTAGAPSWFDNAGMFGVMFLKSYLGLSDEKLVDRLNTDWELQMFCGRQFGDNQRIKDRNLPSRIRCYIGQNFSLESFQDIVIENWKPYLEDTHCSLFDATAYESYIKYPTDVKLLWDCCVWVFESIFMLSKDLGQKKTTFKIPRTKPETNGLFKNKEENI